MQVGASINETGFLGDLSQDECCLRSVSQPELQSACQTTEAAGEPYYEWNELEEQCNWVSPSLIQSMTSTGVLVGEPREMNANELAGRYYCCNESAGTDPALIGACDIKTEVLGEMLYYDQDADMCGIFQTMRSVYTIFGDQNTEVGEAVLEKTLTQE